MPKGRLLEQHVDLDGPLGVAYERSVGFAKPDHIHTRHMLVLPRGAAVMNIVANGKRHRVDGRHLLWVPRQAPHADESVTTLYDTLALYPATALYERALAEAEVSEADHRRFDGYLGARRSPFFDGLLEQYFATRLVMRTAADPFQERQLLGVALGLLAGKRVTRPVAGAMQDDGLSAGEKAIRFIEANLFLPISLDAIARQAGASTSTLLRSFREATGQTPYAYVKTRRLDEAKHLLEGGKHPVGEVALLVGYEDFSAFSKAFRGKFDKSPSDYLRVAR